MKILHITDVHVGWEADLGREKQAWERLYRETAAVAAGSGKADILAVTGDLVTNGTEERKTTFRAWENFWELIRNKCSFAVAITILTHRRQDPHFMNMRHLWRDFTVEGLLPARYCRYSVSIPVRRRH